MVAMPAAPLGAAVFVHKIRLTRPCTTLAARFRASFVEKIHCRNTLAAHAAVAFANLDAALAAATATHAQGHCIVANELDTPSAEASRAFGHRFGLHGFVNCGWMLFLQQTGTVAH